MLISDVLNAKGRRVISIGPEATVKEALALFVEYNIGSLPVVAVSGQLIGIFTERDVLFGDHYDLERFHQRLIKEVQTSDPITCSPTNTLAEAMGKMASHRVGQLPVVAGGELVGLVSVGDLVQALNEQIGAENQHLMNYLHGRS
jgi:CBS domain-containing protein